MGWNPSEITYRLFKFKKTNSCNRLYLDYILFPEGVTGVPCPPLVDSVAPSFAISGHDLLIAGDLFEDPCASFDHLIWDV